MTNVCVCVRVAFRFLEIVGILKWTRYAECVPHYRDINTFIDLTLASSTSYQYVCVSVVFVDLHY